MLATEVRKRAGVRSGNRVLGEKHQERETWYRWNKAGHLGMEHRWGEGQVPTHLAGQGQEGGAESMPITVWGARVGGLRLSESWNLK